MQLNPRHWIVAHKSGFLLHELGRFEEACAQFDLCDQLQPNHASTLQARALSLRSLNRLDQAMADYKSAHALDPDAAGTPAISARSLRCRLAGRKRRCIGSTKPLRCSRT
ncbi:MAG: tetratricopeptide repeat protein [Bradyrhizobium sp.]